MITSILNSDEIQCVRSIMQVGTTRAQQLVSFCEQVLGTESKGAPKSALRALDKQAGMLDNTFPQLRTKRGGRKPDPNSAAQRVYAGVIAAISKGITDRKEILLFVKKKHPNLTAKQIEFNAGSTPGVVRKYGVWNLYK